MALYRLYIVAILLVAIKCIFSRDIFVDEPEEFTVDLHRQRYTREKCYDELGCFSTGGDFAKRPVNLLPADRNKINTRFLLHTRTNPNTYDAIYLKAGDLQTLRDSLFDPLKPSKMIVHGLTDSGFSEWVKDLRSELLLHGDYNVIQVDWGGGSSLPYTQATANARLVGAEVALMIDFLCKETGVKAKDFHIIGHSLGSHIGGYAGERLESLGRITGLDPADPYFENMPSSVRLDETDAIYVDVLHTDGAHIVNAVLTKGGFGLYQAIATHDFYPNNGRDQPNCAKSPVRDIINDGITEAALQFVACSHTRALDLMKETIHSICPYKAYPCQDWETFQEGKCLECSGDGCGYMGFHANKYPRTPGVSNRHLYLVTGGREPFCRYHYGISVSISNNYSKSQAGWLHVEITGTRGAIATRLTRKPDSKKSFEIKPGHVYTSLATDIQDIGEATSVRVWWECDSNWWNILSYCSLRTTNVYIDRVEIIQGETQTSSSFCANDTILKPKETLLLARDSC